VERQNLNKAQTQVLEKRKDEKKERRLSSSAGNVLSPSRWRVKQVCFKA
jgi:hypothetical protein